MGTLTLHPLPVGDQGFALGFHPVPSSSGGERARLLGEAWGAHGARGGAQRGSQLNQSERERETWGDQYFEKLIPILYFPWSTFIH